MKQIWRYQDGEKPTPAAMVEWIFLWLMVLELAAIIAVGVAYIINTANVAFYAPLPVDCTAIAEVVRSHLAWMAIGAYALIPTAVVYVVARLIAGKGK
jgi:hypothetical protein